MTTERLEPVSGTAYDYLLYRPDGYDEAAAWPVVFFFHGAGERGSDLSLLRRHGPPKLVAEGASLPFLLVAPQCPRGSGWALERLRVLVDEATGRLAADETRLYLTGISMGGYAAWALALLEPHRYAAIAPICGGGDPDRAARIRHLPVWTFHGALDDVVPIGETDRMVEALRACGGNVRYTVYPDARHDAWTRTYADPALFEWLLGHRRSREDARARPA